MRKTPTTTATDTITITYCDCYNYYYSSSLGFSAVRGRARAGWDACWPMKASNPGL